MGKQIKPVHPLEPRLHLSQARVERGGAKNPLNPLPFALTDDALRVRVFRFAQAVLKKVVAPHQWLSATSTTRLLKRYNTGLAQAKGVRAGTS
jgi:hypothetical protein